MVYTIKSALYKGTHLILPERLLFPPQPGNAELWTVQGNQHHIMIQPNTEEPQGAKTNLTIVTESNTSYHFVLMRVPFKDAESCVEVKKGNEFFESAGMGQKAEYKTPCEKREDDLRLRIGVLQRKIIALNKQIEEERVSLDERINAAVSKYRSMIYTRYIWSDGSGFKGKDLVSDVWDDGRFTFIRSRFDNRGALAIKAEIDGDEEMLEYNMDSESVYRIAGIYPVFFMIYNKKNKIKVERKDNKSNSVY
jgi:type IV secretory pathway VirB9-like protein